MTEWTMVVEEAGLLEGVAAADELINSLLVVVLG